MMCGSLSNTQKIEKRTVEDAGPYRILFSTVGTSVLDSPENKGIPHFIPEPQILRLAICHLKWAYMSMLYKPLKFVAD